MSRDGRRSVMVMVMVMPAGSSPVSPSLPVLCLLRPLVASAQRDTADRICTQAACPRAQGCGALQASTPARAPQPALPALPAPHAPALSRPANPHTHPRAVRHGTTWGPASPAGSAPILGPLPAELPAAARPRVTYACAGPRRPAALRQRLRGRCAAGFSSSRDCQGPGGGWGAGMGQ